MYAKNKTDIVASVDDDNIPSKLGQKLIGW